MKCRACQKKRVKGGVINAQPHFERINMYRRKVWRTLSAEAEVLFYRLIVKADDFGLYYGSPKILASLLSAERTDRKEGVFLAG